MALRGHFTGLYRTLKNYVVLKFFVDHDTEE